MPDSFWRSFFLTSHLTLSKFWGPIIGPFVAIISFVCSVGNIPLAAVLWNGGISFGGVVAFILADLIVLPILDIYRRYYGMKMTVFILATFYISMSVAALVIEFVFQGLGLIPLHQARVIQASVALDYTTVLNIVFLVLAGLLVWRFFTTGGPMMLRRMTSSDHRSQMGGESHGGHTQRRDAISQRRRARSRAPPVHSLRKVSSGASPTRLVAAKPSCCTSFWRSLRAPKQR